MTTARVSHLAHFGPKNFRGVNKISRPVNLSFTGIINDKPDRLRVGKCQGQFGRDNV
jgi:hypothetical protein